MALQKAMVSSKSNEWTTPDRLFKELDKEFNFTLDPCCRHDTAKCKKHYTIEDDGLKQDWSNERVFMNPPYGGHTGDWMKKAVEESRKGALVVCLIVSSTDRSYLHEYIFPYAVEVRFIRGRVRFSECESTAPFASAIVIFNGLKENERNHNPKIVYYDKSINKRYSEEDSFKEQMEGKR